ncbi:MAG TPA: hypothetical protein VMD53_07065 [Rhizomicrobium sp.]|nr:hypothetical protein [Rhizomicrobium sp.]
MAPARSAVSPLEGWLLVLILTAAAVLSYTDRQILSLIVDPVRHSLRIRESQVGVIRGTAFAVLYSAGPRRALRSCSSIWLHAARGVRKRLCARRLRDHVQAA